MHTSHPRHRLAAPSSGPRRPGSQTALAGAALLALTVACQPPSSVPRPVPDVRLSFIQQRPDEGTARGNLRVVSRARRPLTVSAVGLDWRGYGGSRLVAYSTTVQPGQTLDLRMTMPAPTCTARPASAYGLVVLDGLRVRSRIDPSGQGYLRRMWRRACDQSTFARTVRYAYTGPWRTVRYRGYDALSGRLVLRRRSGTAPVRLDALTGSVLFDLRLAHPLVLRHGQESSSAALLLDPGRCDAHGLASSQQTFVFRATVRLAGGRPMRVYVEPGREAVAHANAMLRRACH